MGPARHTKNNSFVLTLVNQLVVVISFTTHVILRKATAWLQTESNAGKRNQIVLVRFPHTTIQHHTIDFGVFFYLFLIKEYVVRNCLHMVNVYLFIYFICYWFFLLLYRALMQNSPSWLSYPVEIKNLWLWLCHVYMFLIKI